jgi:hypothetical protein
VVREMFVPKREEVTGEEKRNAYRVLMGET